MSIRIGINGFGRIGRLVFRAAMKQNDVTVVGINDLLDVNHLAYLLKYDSVHGNYDGTIEVEGSNLVVDGRTINISAERDPKAIGWGNLNTDIVAECTGIFTTLEKAQSHIDGGAKKVVISAPSADAPMFVMGVNHDDVKNWTKDLVIDKTFAGLQIQLDILEMVSETGEFRLSTPDEESQGIDGYVDGEPVSIKPNTYKKTIQSGKESIPYRIIFYKNTKRGLVVS